MGAEFSSRGPGTDLAPLRKDLRDDACHAPHRGDMISGELVVTSIDGREEVCEANDLICCPPEHSVRRVRDAEVILFSPQHEHAVAIDPTPEKMRGSQAASATIPTHRRSHQHTRNP